MIKNSCSNQQSVLFFMTIPLKNTKEFYNTSDVMLCKLSQDSILELRLIPLSLDPTQQNCPCCGQPFIVHQTQKSNITKRGILYLSI
jgi:hypothetical protein